MGFPNKHHAPTVRRGGFNIGAIRCRPRDGAEPVQRLYTEVVGSSSAADPEVLPRLAPGAYAAVRVAHRITRNGGYRPVTFSGDGRYSGLFSVLDSHRPRRARRATGGTPTTLGQRGTPPPVALEAFSAPPGCSLYLPERSGPVEEGRRLSVGRASPAQDLHALRRQEKEAVGDRT
jgi:hypothetical protein